jgi:hypothetical protein
MASERQLEANRANARRSSGPRTRDGKASSSKNALKHGFTSRLDLMADEDPAAFDVLRDGLEADFQPRSTVERELVSDLTGQLWRLRRLRALEASLLEYRQEQAEDALREQRNQRVDRERTAFRQTNRLAIRFAETVADPDDKGQVDAFLRGLTDQELDLLLDFSLVYQNEVTPKVREERRTLARDNPLEFLAGLLPRRPAKAKPGTEAERERRRVNAVALIKDGEDDDALGKLRRYESRIRNDIARTLNQLYLLRDWQADNGMIESVTSQPPRPKPKRNSKTR